MQMANRVASYRRTLRHEILKAFPGVALKDVSAKLRAPGQDCIRFADLAPYCCSATIPAAALPGIFSAYKVYVDRISEAKFINFLQDEVRFKLDQLPSSPNLSESQTAALRSFASIMKSRKTHDYRAGGPSQRGSTPYQLSYLWSYLTKLNSVQTDEKHVRVATLCRLAAELEIPVTAEEFIDALFAFYGRKLDQIDFNEFVRLMEAFE